MWKVLWLVSAAKMQHVDHVSLPINRIIRTSLTLRKFLLVFAQCPPRRVQVVT